MGRINLLAHPVSSGRLFLWSESGRGLLKSKDARKIVYNIISDTKKISESPFKIEKSLPQFIYRGIKIRPSKLKHLKIGEKLPRKFYGPSSFSKKKSVALDFALSGSGKHDYVPVILKMEPGGTRRWADMDKLSIYDESEVIGSLGSRNKIKSIILRPFKKIDKEVVFKPEILSGKSEPLVKKHKLPQTRVPWIAEIELTKSSSMNI